jgi:peptide/nickel transport system ATP-binding protein
VFGNPQHPYTKKLMAAVPIPDHALRDKKRGVSNDEIRSPMRAPDYQPPLRQYKEVTPATSSSFGARNGRASRHLSS